MARRKSDDRMTKDDCERDYRVARRKSDHRMTKDDCVRACYLYTRKPSDRMTNDDREGACEVANRKSSLDDKGKYSGLKICRTAKDSFRSTRNITTYRVKTDKETHLKRRLQCTYILTVSTSDSLQKFILFTVFMYE